MQILYQTGIVLLTLRKPDGHVVLVRERARWGALEVKPEGQGGATPCRCEGYRGVGGREPGWALLVATRDHTAGGHGRILSRRT